MAYILVFKNFDAIYSYNAAESYGLAIAHLSDPRAGRHFLTPWPTDDAGTSRAERREIQQFGWLSAVGGIGAVRWIDWG